MLIYSVIWTGIYRACGVASDLVRIIDRSSLKHILLDLIVRMQLQNSYRESYREKTLTCET